MKYKYNHSVRTMAPSGVGCETVRGLGTLPWLKERKHGDCVCTSSLLTTADLFSQTLLI